MQAKSSKYIYIPGLAIQKVAFSPCYAGFYIGWTSDVESGIDFIS